MDVIIRRKPVTIPVLPILAAVVLVVLAFTAISVGRIQGNQIGVLVNNWTGNVEVRQQTGALLYNGLTLASEEQDLNVAQTLAEEMRGKTLKIEAETDAMVVVIDQVSTQATNPLDVRAMMEKLGLGETPQLP